MHHHLIVSPKKIEPEHTFSAVPIWPAHKLSFSAGDHIKKQIEQFGNDFIKVQSIYLKHICKK